MVNILLTLVTSLGSVMLPRVAHLLVTGDYKAVNKMHEMSFLVYNLVIFPMMAGILIVNDDFCSVFPWSRFSGCTLCNRHYDLPYVLYRLDQYHGNTDTDTSQSK